MKIKSSELSHKGKTIVKNIIKNNGKKYSLEDTLAQLDEILKNEKESK